MKILHIISNEKFTLEYINFINVNFDNSQHKFYIFGNKKFNKYQSNIRIFKKKDIFLLISEMRSSNKIILHGLYPSKIIILLFFQKKLLNKTYWLIWGGDLYSYKDRNKKFNTKIYEIFKRSVIRNIKGLISPIVGEYKLVKKWYNANGRYFNCIGYPSNVFKNDKNVNIKKDDKIEYIQVGNSSDPSNNHLEIFSKLEKYKNQNIKIVCPLSYGPKLYRNTVLAEGERIFKDKFVPLLKFLDRESYIEILSNIDIAIFNHNRQQAMGNIITLLGMGKKVYIRNDITTWDFFNKHYIKIFNSNSNLDQLLSCMNEKDKQKNSKIIKDLFSIYNLKKQWNDVFEY